MLWSAGQANDALVQIEPTKPRLRSMMLWLRPS